MAENQKQSNRLMNEKSPYLLQHAHNPVDWYPWGDEAFAKAKSEDKPIFLSIGYSTCHWCHVMAHESFEDDEVAALLNANFVAIKVDREERPDIDSVYMTVCQALTGEGGWPLTIVMSPDKRPFFAGTYFPKDKKYGRLGLIELLQRLLYEWRHNRAKVESAGEQIAKAISSTHERPESTAGPTAQWLSDAFHNLAAEFDAEYGGFGSAPKFPTPHNLSFLLRYHAQTGDMDALHMATKTLTAMREGGIWDEVGFGFARYSVDRRWLIPHFEKMLYDNALLAIAYLEAFQVTEEPLFARTAKQIFEYVVREMRAPEGVFYSAQDADSEGEEGKFYAWDADEIQRVLAGVLGPETADLYCQYYGVTDHGNFDGRNILNTIGRSDDVFCHEHAISPEAFHQQLEAARQTLFAVRETRIHPHKDDKVLTSWNGLMIAALAKAAQVLGEPSYADLAAESARFILTHLRREDGRLLARYREGDAGILGYLDDYAFLVWGLIELYEAAFDESVLQAAIDLSRQMLTLFADPDGGGLFLTGSDGEALIARPKEVYDGALPSGNSVAAMNLIRLARLTGDVSLEQAAEVTLRAFSAQVENYPSGYTHYLMAAMHLLAPGKEIVIVGERDDEPCQKMIRAVQSQLLLASVWMVRSPNRQSDVMPFLTNYPLLDGRATAYVCENFACQTPTVDLGVLKDMLANSASGT